MKRSLFAVAILAAAALVGFNHRGDLVATGLKFVAPSIFDKANVHAPETGEIVYDSSVSKFYGRDQNSNWVEMSTGSSIIPAGVVMPFAGTNTPNGYLPCDGAAVSRETYADLFATIGTSYGAGDGVTTFNVPDYRGRFLRGVDGGTGRDPDASSRAAMNAGGNTGSLIGSVQGQATRKNGLSLTDPGHSHSLPGGYGNNTGARNYAQMSEASNNYPKTLPSATTGITLNNGDSETRPVNAYVNYIIKY